MHTCVCVCACVYCVCLCVCIACMCARMLDDKGGASIPMVPRNVSQEPVSCPSPAHVGEQSSFQLTAAHVC